MFIALRTDGNPLALAPALRKEVSLLNKNLAVSNLSPAEDLVSTSTAQRRLTTALIGLFAGLALLLAAVGIYGVMSYAVSQRTQEIGIRMALGANRTTILGLVLRQGLLLAGIGVTLGLGAAVALRGVVKNLLFEVSTFDLSIYAAIIGLLVAVAIVACVFPARRASRVDPMIALRYE
jgi:ABC-type antimicrobial peptide transport system permease subunit